MKKATVAILFLLSFCSAIAAMWGFAVERAARGIIADFKIVLLRSEMSGSKA